MEAVKRVIDAEALDKQNGMRLAVADGNFHDAVLFEGQIQGVLSLITLLGRFGRVG